jgi:hypothetical protein
MRSAALTPASGRGLRHIQSGDLVRQDAEDRGPTPVRVITGRKLARPNVRIGAKKPNHLRLSSCGFCTLGGGRVAIMLQRTIRHTGLARRAQLGASCASNDLGATCSESTFVEISECNDYNGL